MGTSPTVVSSSVKKKEEKMEVRMIKVEHQKCYTHIYNALPNYQDRVTFVSSIHHVCFIIFCAFK